MPSRALCSLQHKELRERMPQAGGLVRHDAKHNPSGSLEESCFCTALDHILHEAGIYLGSSAGFEQQLPLGRNFLAERKRLVRKTVSLTSAAGASQWLQSDQDTCGCAHQHPQLCSLGAARLHQVCPRHSGSL